MSFCGLHPAAGRVSGRMLRVLVTLAVLLSAAGAVPGAPAQDHAVGPNGLNADHGRTLAHEHAGHCGSAVCLAVPASVGRMAAGSRRLGTQRLPHQIVPPSPLLARDPPVPRDI